MLLRNQFLDQCLMNGSFGCVQNIVYHSPTGPWVSSALPDYVLANFPKCLISQYHNFFRLTPLNSIHVISSIRYIHIHACMPSVLVILTPYPPHTYMCVCPLLLCYLHLTLRILCGGAQLFTPTCMHWIHPVKQGLLLLRWCR